MAHAALLGLRLLTGDQPPTPDTAPATTGVAPPNTAGGGGAAGGPVGWAKRDTPMCQLNGEVLLVGDSRGILAGGKVKKTKARLLV